MKMLVRFRICDTGTIFRQGFKATCACFLRFMNVKNVSETEKLSCEECSSFGVIRSST